MDVDAIMARIPTVARLYYTGLGSRRYRRASVHNGPGEPLVHRSHVERELRRLLAEHALGVKEACAAMCRDGCAEAAVGGAACGQQCAVADGVPGSEGGRG